MQITPKHLNDFGYTTKNLLNNPLTQVFFSKDRESYVTVDFKHNYLVANKFINERPKEIFRGHIESEGQLQEIINQIK